jgi:hypothetical protein
MPLFKSHPEPAPVVETAPPARKGSIFSRRRSVSPARANTTHTTQTSSTSPTRRGGGGFFAHRRSSSSSSVNNNSVRSGTSNRNGGSLFGGGGRFDVHKDPTILAAREKVGIAEHAEAEADRALVQARAMVREAKEHVRVLEREAREEYVFFQLLFS